MRGGPGVPPAVARAFLRSAQDRLCPCRFTAKMAVPQLAGTMPTPQRARRQRQKPRQVYLAPQRQSLKFDYNGGYASVVIPTVHGHQMVVFE